MHGTSNIIKRQRMARIACKALQYSKRYIYILYIYTYFKGLNHYKQYYAIYILESCNALHAISASAQVCVLESIWKITNSNQYLSGFIKSYQGQKLNYMIIFKRLGYHFSHTKAVLNQIAYTFSTAHCKQFVGS